MTIQEILRSKERADVVTIVPDASVHEAMQVLVRHNIGALVVLESDEIRGIITERDLLRAGAEHPERLRNALVRELMTQEVITAPETVELRQVMDTMTERRIRHLPITQGGKLRGMISIGDVVNALRQSTEAENRHLHSYIAGTPM
jgi:CBS domain-containing protein